MTKQEAAQANFSKGYNCCQAVLVAFQEELGHDRGTGGPAGFRHGGRGGPAAGALRGGERHGPDRRLLPGYSLPDDQANKARTYAQVRGLIEAFGQAHGAILCRGAAGGYPHCPRPGPGAPLPPGITPSGPAWPWWGTRPPGWRPSWRKPAPARISGAPVPRKGGAMEDTFSLRVIARLHCDFTTKFGIPPPKRPGAGGNAPPSYLSPRSGTPTPYGAFPAIPTCG